jgi:hypothetical protein
LTNSELIEQTTLPEKAICDIYSSHTVQRDKHTLYAKRSKAGYKMCVYAFSELFFPTK